MSERTHDLTKARHIQALRRAGRLGTDWIMGLASRGAPRWQRLEPLPAAPADRAHAQDPVQDQADESSSAHERSPADTSTDVSTHPSTKGQNPEAWTAERVAHRLGLEPHPEDPQRFGRRGAWLSMSFEADALDASDVEARELLWSELLALRLALDTQASGYDPSQERAQAPAQIWRKEDVPELHGERRPWLVPTQSALRLAELLEQPLLEQPWVDSSLTTIYVLERGLHQHVLTLAQAQATGLDQARLRADARQGLFYDSYKTRAQHRRDWWGRTRIYSTVEGLGCSRAQLLPDFDYDAAQDRGLALLPDRDTLIVVQPEPEPAARQAALEALLALGRSVREDSALPLPLVVYALSTEAISRLA